MDYDVNKLSRTTHVENPRNEESLISKIAKWAINENITLSALKNVLLLFSSLYVKYLDVIIYQKIREHF